MKKIDLDHIEKQLPFKSPDGYFDQLENKIQAEISARRSKQNPSIYWKWSLVPAVAMLIFISFYLIENSENQSADQLIAELSTNDIINYLETSELSEYELTEITIQYDDQMESLNPLEELNIEETEIDELINEYDLIDLNIEEI